MILWGKVTSNCSCQLNNNDVTSLSSSTSLQKEGRKVSEQKKTVWESNPYFLSRDFSKKEKKSCKLLEFLLTLLN